MKKARYVNVPSEYRRNYKAEALELCAKIALTFVSVFSMMLMLVLWS